MNHERPTKKPTAPTNPEAREALLRELPALIGTQWADAVCTEALQTRGSVEGGWPCTLPEARSRVAQALGHRLTVLRWAPLTPHELADAAAAAYAGARRAWQQAAKSLGRRGMARPQAPKPVG